jgi:hypothetical protein
MNFIKLLFKSQKEMCIELYNKAKQKQSGKQDSEYFKLILLTRPPFDYQLDILIDEILQKFNSIEELADYIVEIKKDDYLWDSRKRNLKYSNVDLRKRNKDFFRSFWRN